MKHLKYLFIIIACAWGEILYAQSITITGELSENSYARVLTHYQNQFGKWNNTELDENFPFAMIRVKLEGNRYQIREAKQNLRLYLGTMKNITDMYSQSENEILFLIERGKRTVYLTGGDGCEKQLLADHFIFRPDYVYECQVRYSVDNIATNETGVALWTLDPAQKQHIQQYSVFTVFSGSDTIYRGNYDLDQFVLKRYPIQQTFFYTIECPLYKTITDSFQLDSVDQVLKTYIHMTDYYNYLSLHSSEEPILFTVDNDTTVYSSVSDSVGPFTAASHTLHLQQENHYSRDTTIDLPGTCQTISLSPILVHHEGTLNVSSNIPASDVYCDDQYIGKSPLQNISLLTGKHHIRLVANGYLPQESTVEINHNQNTAITIDLSVFRFGNHVARGQVSSVSAQQQGTKILINYDLKKYAHVQAEWAKEEGSFTNMKSVSGDVNHYVEPGRNRQIVWDVIEDCGSHFTADNLRFRVYGSLLTNKNFALLNTSCNLMGSYAPLSQRWTIGAMYGQVRRVGWFIKARTGFHYASGQLYSEGGKCYKKGQSQEIEALYTGESARMLIAGTGGAVFRLGCPLYLYAGAGYGYQALDWKTNADSWVRIKEYTMGSGLAVDGGLMYIIKNWVISAGVCSIIGFEGSKTREVQTESGTQTINRPLPIDLEIGLGYSF